MRLGALSGPEATFPHVAKGATVKCEKQSRQTQVTPKYRTDSPCLQNLVPLLGAPGGLKLAGQEEIVPADDAVPDEAVAALGDLLGFLFGMFDAARVSGRDGPGEAAREFDLAELFLDRLPQLDLVDVEQDEHRLDDLAEGLHRGVEPVLPGV